MLFTFDLMAIVQSKFRMIGPVIINTDQKPISYLILFAIVLLCAIIVAIVNRSTDKATDRNGKELFGIVTTTKFAARKHNGHVYTIASIKVVLEDGNVTEFTEKLNEDFEKIEVQDFVKVKFFNNDINVVCKVSDTEVPEQLKSILKSDK